MKLGILLSAVMLAACGSSGIGTDVGSGTQTLLVQGRVDWNADSNSSGIEVTVERAGAQVTDATVVVHSDRGDVTLVHQDGNRYVGTQAGWGGGYAIDVVAGADHLDGSIGAPEPMTLVSPDPTVAIDAHAAANGIVTLRWSGEAAESIRVKSKDFDYEGADEGHVDMPAQGLKDTSQELELRRANSVVLAGGVAGSTLSASCRASFTLIVVNPF
jgi:hypothetical protein